MKNKNECPLTSRFLISVTEKLKVFTLQILPHYLIKEGRITKFFYCLIWIKEPCVQKFEWLTHLKILGILQTDILSQIVMLKEPQYYTENWFTTNNSNSQTFVFKKIKLEIR